LTARVLLHVYPSFAVGGAQARFAAIANHFGRRWHHAIVAMDGNLACRERLDPGLDLSFPQIDLPKGDMLANLRRIRGVLREMRPHRLVTGNWGSIEWAMANAVRPLVAHVHVEDGFGPEERQRQIPRRVLTRRLVLRRCLTVLPSRTLLKIATDIWRLPQANLRYVPNGVDLACFTPATLRSGIPVIGTVAALRAEKNIARLLRAFALATTDLPGRLVIVGDGPERSSLESLAATLGIAARVEFAGHQTDPSAFYAGFDLFALSSDTEQMPLTVLEAMAAGLPVASTDVGDVRDMLSEESQDFIAPCDDVGLAERLRMLLSSPDARRRAGDANRRKAVQDYDQARMFAAYADVFDDLHPDDEMASSPPAFSTLVG
jgi:glycosyltransferase involved in cell wall biosynthesis